MNWCGLSPVYRPHFARLSTTLVDKQQVVLAQIPFCPSLIAAHFDQAEFTQEVKLPPYLPVMESCAFHFFCQCADGHSLC